MHQVNMPKCNFKIVWEEILTQTKFENPLAKARIKKTEKYGNQKGKRRPVFISLRQNVNTKKTKKEMKNMNE